MKTKIRNYFLAALTILLIFCSFAAIQFFYAKGEESIDINLDFSTNADDYFITEYMGWRTDLEKEQLIPNAPYSAARYNKELSPDMNFKISFDYSVSGSNDMMFFGLFSIADDSGGVSYSEGYGISSTAASGDLLYGPNNGKWSLNHIAGPQNNVNLKEGSHSLEFTVWEKTLTIRLDGNYWYGSAELQPALDPSTVAGYFKFQTGNQGATWIDNFKVETLTENPYNTVLAPDSVELDFSTNADGYFSAEYLGWKTDSEQGKFIPSGPYAAVRYNGILSPNTNFKISFDYSAPSQNDQLKIGIFSIADNSGTVSFAEGYSLISAASGDLLYGINNGGWNLNQKTGPKNDVNMKVGEHSLEIIVWERTITIRLDKQFWYGSNETQPALDADTPDGHFKFQLGNVMNAWLDNFKVEVLTENPYPIYDLQGLKSAKMQELQEYVEGKSESDYTAENWAQLSELLEEGKQNINVAESEEQVMQAFADSIAAINGIPVKFDSYTDFSDGTIPSYFKLVNGTFTVTEDGNRYLTSQTAWNVLVFNKSMDNFRLDFDFRKPLGSNSFVINFCVQTNDGLFNNGYTFMIGGNGITVNLDGNSGSQIWKMSGNTGYVDGKWHHVTVYHVADKIAVLFDDTAFEATSKDATVQYESGVWQDNTYSKGFVTLATDGAIDIDNFETSALEIFPQSVEKISATGTFEAEKLQSLPANWVTEDVQISETEGKKSISVGTNGSIDFVPDGSSSLYNFSIQIKMIGMAEENGVLYVKFRAIGNSGYVLEIGQEYVKLSDLKTGKLLKETDFAMLNDKQQITITADGTLIDVYARNEKVLEVEDGTYFYGGLSLETSKAKLSIESVSIGNPITYEGEVQNNDVSYLPDTKTDTFVPKSGGCSQNISGNIAWISIVLVVATYMMIKKKKV